MARIVVLDDYEPMVRLYVEVLKRMGHEPVGTTDAYAAIAGMRAGEVALLIQDIERPVMDGRELYQFMKADPALCNIPILILSGHNAKDGVGEMSVEGFMQKDVLSLNEYRGVVQRILSGGRAFVTGEGAAANA